MGRVRRTDHVIAALDDRGRNIGQPVHVREQSAGRQKKPVREIMGLKPRQAEGGAIMHQAQSGAGWGGLLVGHQSAAGAFVRGPRLRRRHVHRRVRIGQPAQVGSEQVAPFGQGQKARKLGVGLGKYGGHAVQEPVDLDLPPQENPAQHHARHPVRMGLGIGQRQGRAPGAAEYQPAR